MSTRDERDLARVRMLAALMTGLHREVADTVRDRLEDDGEVVAMKLSETATEIMNSAITEDEILGLDVESMGLVLRALGMIELSASQHSGDEARKAFENAFHLITTDPEFEPAEDTVLLRDIKLYAEGVLLDRKQSGDRPAPDLAHVHAPVRSTEQIINETWAVHVMSDERGWVHTHGLASLGLPELEMRGVPLYLMHDAAHILHTIACYMYEGKHAIGGARPVMLGQTIKIDHAVMGFEVAEPMPDEASHYVTERWLITDKPMRGTCAMCDAGEPHEHDSASN